MHVHILRALNQCNPMKKNNFLGILGGDSPQPLNWRPLYLTLNCPDGADALWNKLLLLLNNHIKKQDWGYPTFSVIQFRQLKSFVRLNCFQNPTNIPRVHRSSPPAGFRGSTGNSDRVVHPSRHLLELCVDLSWRKLASREIAQD